jgi:hypothetical protein
MESGKGDEALMPLEIWISIIAGLAVVIFIALGSNKK